MACGAETRTTALTRIGRSSGLLADNLTFRQPHLPPISRALRALPGIPLQMADDTGGILVDGVEDCARAMVELLRDPERAHALGASGRERMRRHFLIPRLVLDKLSLMRRLTAGAGAARAFEAITKRDPVCGMTLQAAEETLPLDGITLRFCSRQCRDKFVAAPDRYLPRSGTVSVPLGDQPDAP